MKKIILGLSILAIATTSVFVACSKKSSSTNTTTGNENVGKQTTLQRTSLGAYQVSTVGDSFNVNLDLMDDFTWSGDMIFDTNTVPTYSVSFSNPQTSISISNADSGKLNLTVIDTLNSSTTNFELKNFSNPDANSYQFDVYAGGVFVKTFSVVSNQFSSLEDFKTSLINNWNANSTMLKTTWVVHAIRALATLVAVVTVAVNNHCTNVVKEARAACSTPPCTFEAHFCSANCHCPN